MYSRFPRNGDRTIRIPEHYSGCAFSETSAESMIPQKEEPTPPPPTTEPTAPPPPPEEDKKDQDSQPTSLPLALPLGGNLPLLGGGLGFEELLLIGLILLLSRSEQDNDLVLWLVLLLFCK